MLAIVLAILSWGACGPVLHKGQAKMHHSRLRPLLCVGRDGSNVPLTCPLTVTMS